MEVAELAHWSRALTEVPSSIPTTHTATHNHLKLHPVPILASSGTRHASGVLITCGQTMKTETALQHLCLTAQRFPFLCLCDAPVTFTDV